MNYQQIFKQMRNEKSKSPKLLLINILKLL